MMEQLLAEVQVAITSDMVRRLERLRRIKRAGQKACGGLNLIASLPTAHRANQIHQRITVHRLSEEADGASFKIKGFRIR